MNMNNVLCRVQLKRTMECSVIANRYKGHWVMGLWRRPWMLLLWMHNIYLPA